MGVAVLNPQDCLKQPFSYMKIPRNPNSCPNRQKKQVSNRNRKSPLRKQTSRSPPPRNQSSRSPSPVAPPLPPPHVAVSGFVPKETVKKNLSNSVIVGPVRILKRGEEIPKKTADLLVEKSDLGSTHRIGPDPGMIPAQIRLSVRKSKIPPFYAGPVTMTSPPPSDVPLPAFFTTKKSVSLFQATDATNDLIRILRLDIA